MDSPLPYAAPANASRGAPRSRLARGAESAWVLPAHIGVLALAAFVYIFNLSASGYANAFYSMAAQAASQDWSAWFWGSLDASNFITVDKPPLATMLMGLSVRVFGLSSWSILLPEALCGVATIAVLYAIVRRSAGPAAATIAALVATLTPAAVLIFRFNNPDALLTLLLVLAAWAFMRAIEDGRLRWVVLAALFVGLAFNTKFLQAYLVLPAFAAVYAFAAPGSIRRRVAGLAVGFVSLLVFSGWWVLAVQLVPADMRPYVGGSTDGTALQLLLGYDGLARIFGNLGGLVGVDGGIAVDLPTFGGAGSSFSGEPGILRLFDAELGGQIAWLLVFAAIGATASLVLRTRRPRTDVARAAVLMWTFWLVIHAIVFSLMGGIIHSYYVVIMAPAIGALVGTGVVDLWRARSTHPTAAGLALGAAIGATAVLAWALLERTPDFLPGVSTVVLVLGTTMAVVVAILAFVPPDTVMQHARSVKSLSLTAVTIGLIVALVGPAAYAADTMATAYSGGDPAAGPANRRAIFPDLPGGGPAAPPRAADDGRGFRPPPNDGAAPDGLGAPVGGGNFTRREPGGLGQAELAYLVANRGDARWIVAASSSNDAAPIQLATGEPVMAMGGFNGSDPTPTLDQLRAYISSGQLRFVLAAGADFGGFGRGFGEVAGIRAWVRESCELVTVTGGTATDLYDCAQANPG